MSKHYNPTHILKSHKLLGKEILIHLLRESHPNPPAPNMIKQAVSLCNFRLLVPNNKEFCLSYTEEKNKDKDFYTKIKEKKVNDGKTL